MKGLSKLVLGIALSTATLGAAVGGAVLTNNIVKEAEVAEAANTGSAGDVIFFTPSDHWAEASATFKLQWYKNSSYVGSTFMTKYTGTNKISGRDTYYASPTAAFDAVQICRFNPEKTSQWNYSNNSSVSGTKKWLFMSKTCNWDNTWAAGDSSGTTWKNNLDVIKASSDQSPSSSTTRFFVNNSNSHFNPVAIRAWGGSAAGTITGSVVSDGTIYLFTFFEDINSVWYGYADIPTNVTGFKIINCGSNDYNAYDNYYSDDEFTVSGNANCVFYCPSGGNKVTTGGAKDDAAGPELMKHVLEAVDTCSNNSYNGYNAYENLNNYYYSHATAAAKSTSCTSMSGSKTALTKTVQEHFEGMSRRPDSLPGSNILVFMSENNTAYLIAAISVVSISVIVGGYFYFRKRRETSK